MKKTNNMLIVWVAFIIGQGFQILAQTVANNLYAERPVLWCAAAGLVIIILVGLTIRACEPVEETPRPQRRHELPANTSRYYTRSQNE